VPPSLSESMSQSLNHRWSCPVTVVFVLQLCRRNAPPTCTFVRPDSLVQPVDESHGNRLVRVIDFLDEMPHCRAQFRMFHHRAFGAGAVLGIVNALRSASTRPTAVPSGIDDASTRLASGNYAMVVSVSISRRRLTGESCGRMVAPSRQCRMALPPFAATANGARIRPAPKGHGIERNPQISQTDARRPTRVRPCVD
jgi:hypothetical protein